MEIFDHTEDTEFTEKLRNRKTKPGLAQIGRHSDATKKPLCSLCEKSVAAKCN